MAWVNPSPLLRMPRHDGAADWLEWAGFGKFWTQLVRDTMRKSTASNFQAQIEQEKGTAHLTIDALNEAGDFLNNLESDISLIPPNLKKKQLNITQMVPGKYEIDFAVNEMGGVFCQHHAETTRQIG